MFADEFPIGPRGEAIELFRRAFEAQQVEDYAEAIELYQRSIATYPTAEAHTFLGWVYSFQGRYDEAIDECLRAISVDPTLGNPYNDIGSYLIARGDPHLNLGRVYEKRGRLLDAARHYGLALREEPDFAQAATALRRLQTRL